MKLGYNVQHGCCIIYLKIAKIVNLKFSSQEKKVFVTMHGDGC